MARQLKGQSPLTPATLLEELTHQALTTAKKARRHRQKLTSDNFYANKLAELRADAVNAFKDLSTHSAGDTTAMAEMIEAVFSSQTDLRKRTDVARELTFSLRTTFHASKSPAPDPDKDAIFPMNLLTATKRGYLITVGRQMNSCFTQGWYDACAVMMRRLLETAIIEAFEHKALSHKIKDHNGNYLQLSDLIDAALNEAAWTLSRNTKASLPQMRDVGHLSAHSRYFTAQRTDIERVRNGCRIVLEEFFHHANLL